MMSALPPSPAISRLPTRKKRFWNRTHVAAKTEAPKQQFLEQTKKLRVSQLEDSRRNILDSDRTRVSGLPMSSNQNCVYCSIDQSIQRILQHLENTSSALKKRKIKDLHYTPPSNSDAVAQQIFPPGCHSENGQDSTAYSISCESSSNSSICSNLSVFSDWQLRSDSAPDLLEKESPVSRSQSTPVPTFQLMDTEKSDPVQNFAVLLSFQTQTNLRKKDPKHVLELNLEQRIIGFPEERIKSHRSQGTNVELTPKVPSSVTDSTKVTPTALLEVIDSIGLTPDLHSEVTDSVELTPKVPHTATDSIKVTPMALFQVMDSMGLSPHSDSEVTDSVQKTKDKTNLSQSFNQAETGSIPPKSSNPMIESRKEASPQQQTRFSKSAASRPNQITDVSKVTPVALLPILDSRRLINECSGVIDSEGIAPKPQHQVMESVGVDTLQKHEAVEAAQMSLGPHPTVFKAGERIPQPRDKVEKTLNMDPGSQNQATKRIRFAPSSLQPPQPPSKVLDSSRMIPEPSKKSDNLVNLMVQGSPTGVITPLQAGLIAQSVDQAKDSLELPSASQVQVRESIGMTPHQGTENVLLTPKLPHQVTDPSEFTPRHQDLHCSEVSPRQSHKMIDPMELTSDSWPQRKNTTERTLSHPQITESTDLTPEQQQSVQSEELTPIPQLQTETVDSMKVGKLTTHLCAVKASDVSLNSSYSFPEPEGLTEQQQASGARVTSDTCPQVEESAELTQSSVGMTPAPLSQTSESREMTFPPLQDIPETGTRVVKEMKETPELTNIKGTLNLLPELEVSTINPEMMAPEPQPPDVDFSHVTLEPCSEVTKPEISLNGHTKSTELTLPEVDDTLGTIVEIYSEMGSQGLNLEPRVQTEDSESLVEKLKFEELTSEPSVLVAEPIVLTTGLKPHIIDVIPGPELHNVNSMQIDRGLELQSELSVELVQQSSIGVVDPEKAKPEPGLQSLSPKESVEGTQILNVKSMDLNLGQEQPSVKSGFVPGPQLQSVRFPKLYQGLLIQGENPANPISGPPHYSMKSDEEIYSPKPEIKSSGFIPGPKVPEPEPQHVKCMEVNLGPCLQDVRFSDSIPKRMLHGFKHTQFIPGFPLQERRSQGYMPESFLPLSQQPKFEDRNLALPPQGSEFHSTKFATRVSELQCPPVISKEVNAGPREQDTKFSELASRPNLQGVKFGEQISGSMFVSGNSMTPEVGMQDPNLAKMTPGLQDTRQVSFNSRPWLQDVKCLGVISGTQPQGIKTSELNSGPHLERVKIFELTTQPEKQGMKPEMIVEDSLFQDVKYVTGNQVPSFEDKISYKTVFESQVPTAETRKLAPGRHLENVNHSELIRTPQIQGIASSELIKGQILGHIKPMEKNTVSKQEALTSVELTPGPHLGDVKSTKLRSRSELEHVRSVLSTPGMQAGDGKLEKQALGSNLKGLKPKLLPSKPNIEDGKSVILTLEECLKRIKSTVVSPSSSLRGDMKSVRLIPGSNIQGLKNKWLASSTHVQDVNGMDLKLEPKKQGESPVTFAPRMLSQEKSMEVFRGPQLQGINPNGLTSQPQMQDRKPVIAPCLKQRSLKPETLAKTQGIRGEKIVDFTSTQQYQGMAPMDLTLESRQDDQITVQSQEWKGEIFDQQKKHLESENTLPMESDHKPNPTDMKPIEINSKLKFKDTTSFELAPEPVVQSVKAEEFQNELPVPSMKPGQLTPGSQIQQEKALQSTLDPQLQGVETVAVNTEPQIGNTKSIQWIPISEYKGVKGEGSNSKSQSQDARPTELKSARHTELKPPTAWRGMRSSKLTARSKIQEEKPVAFHLEPQLQGVKSSPLAKGLQEPKTFNLTSEPEPQGITTKELNKEPKAESVRSIQWIPIQEFHSVKFLKSRSGSPFQGVKWTEQKPSIKLGGRKPLGMTQGPKFQGKKSGDSNLRPQEQFVKTLQLSPGPGLQKGGNFTSSSEPQSQCVETVSLHHGPQLENTKSVFQDKKSMQNLGLQPQCITSKELKPSVQEKDVKTSEELMTRPKTMKDKEANYADLQVVGSSDLISRFYSVVPSGLKTRKQKQDGKPHKLSQKSQLQSMKSKVCNHEASLQQIKSADLRTKLRDLKSMKFNSEQQLQDVKSSELGLGTGTQSLGFNPGPQLQETEPSTVSTEVKLLEESPLEFKHEPRLQCRKFRDWRHSKNVMASNTGLQDVESSEFHPCPDLQGIKSKVFCPGLHLEDVNPACTPNINSQYVNSSGYIPGPYLQDMNSSACISEPITQCINSEWNLGRHLHGSNSSSCFSGSKLQCVDSPGSNPESHLQDINSTKCTPEPSPPCVNSTECNPESRLQGVNSIYTLWQNPLYENSNRNNHGPPFQGTNFCSFPPPQILCINPVLCNPRIHLQDINSSTCTLSQESQSVNSMGYNPGAHLQAPKLQEQNLKDLKSEFTPGSNNLGVAPIEYNPGPQLQVNPESKPQCISSVKPSSGPQLKSIKSFELTPGSESQSTKSSVGLNSGSPSQDVNSSNLMLGAKFQRIPFSKNQLGSCQQSAQSIFTLKPQSNGVNSVVLPTSPLEDRKFPEKITQASFCTDTVKLTPDCGLNDLRSKLFSPESCFQNFQGVQLKLASQSQSVSDAELVSCHSSQHPLSSLSPKPCFQDTSPKQLRIGSEQQSLNCQLVPSEETPMMALAPQSTRKLSAGPALTSVQFSSLSLKTQQQNMNSLAFASEPKWQGGKQVKLSSVSLSETGKSVALSPKSILRKVKPGDLMPHTTDPVTKSTKRKYRPERQVVDFAEMTMKPRYQVPKSVNFTSAPIFQDVGSLVMTKGLEHKSTEMMEKPMRLSSNPIDNVIGSLEMPTKPDLQLPEFLDLTPTLSDQDSKSSESHLQKSDQVLETPELHSWSWPEFQDFKNLQIKEVTESDRMTINFKNHVVDTIELTCEARLQGKEFLRVTSKPVNRETGFIENSPRPCPQDLGPLGVGSKKKSQREQSLVSTPRPLCHVPDSASGITPESGPQILKSKNLTSMFCLQKVSSELSVKQTSQVVENRDSVELTFGTEQPGGVAAKLTKPQNLSLENASFTPIESPDQTINLVGISLKQQDQVTESERTQLSVSQSVALPKVSESVEVIPGPPVETITSVKIPKSILQKSKFIDLTSRTHDVISSEFSPSLWLQNVQSKKLIIEPTHQILETKPRPGFQIIKTLLIPKPQLLIAKSEEVAPGPCPQVVEPIRLATRSSIKVKECLNLHPRPHLQYLVRPMELSPKADIQVTSAELIFQQSSPLKEPPVLTHEQRLQAGKSLGLETVSPKLTKIKDPNQGSLCQKKDPETITSARLEGENYISRFIQNPSIPFLSSVDKTTELGPLQGSGVPEVSSSFGTENLGVGILQSSKSYTNPLRIKSSVLPLVLQNLPSDKAGDTKGTPYPEIWSVNVFSKEESEKEKMEEFQRYSSYSFRFLSEEFQAGLGARRSSIRSFLGIQQNVWESHVCRQRLPRRYLSNMLLLGNVLGTTMQRKPCSQSFLTEGSTMDIRQSIQNLFGVPAELMEFSQSLIERVPKTMSQTSGVKNYIQRHTLNHSNEKRMPLKMWTRGSTSSIIQQYSGTRLGVKKTSSKLSDIFQEVTEDVSVSCSGAQFPSLMKSESTLEILYTRKDSVSQEQSEISPCGSLSRTFEPQHSVKTRSHSQSKTNISDHPQLLKELEVKVAGKLLRKQIPHNVPLPLRSGLLLKYPICLQCGRCSGLHCYHKLQSAFGPYILIYPQLHLLSNSEGHGEIRLHLGFRLQTRKRSQDSKYHRRNRADPWRGTASPSRRKDRLSSLASKSPSRRRDFQSRSSLSPASVEIHIQQKQWQPKKSSQPKFIQSLFHHLRQTFQAVHRSVSFSRQKFEYKRRPDRDWLMGFRTPAVRHRSTSSTPTQKNKLQGSSERCRQAEQPKLSNSLLPRPLQLQKTMICGRDVFHQATSVPEPWKRVQNVDSSAKKRYTDEISSQELKKYDKIGAKFQAQERIESKPLLTGFLQRPFAKEINREEQGLFREATQCNNPCEGTQCRLPQRTHQQGLPKRRHHSPLRRYSSPSDRTLRSLSEKSHHSPSQRSSLSSSLRRNPRNFSRRNPRSPSRTSPQILSRRSPCSPPRRNLCSSSSMNPQNPSGSSHHSALGSSLQSTSGRSPRSPLRSPHSPWRCPCSPGRRGPRSLSRRSPRSPSRRNLHSPSSRSPQNGPWSSHHSPSGSSLQRPSGRSPSSSSGRSPY